MSPVWQFTVGNRSAPVDTSWGTALHDVNGDGFADVVTTSPGSVYVFLGNNTGVRGSPSSPTATLSDPGMSLGAAFAGRPINVGDVDGDGRAEIFVGDAGYNGGAGQAYIYYGTSSGMPGMPFILPVAATSPGAFGQRTVLCDVNGDGWDDAFVTAGSGGGRVYVYYGGPSGLRTTFDVSFRAPTGSGSEFGGGIACAGDTNGDGFADLVVSDRSVGATTMSSTAGMVYVYSGSASGLGSIPTPSVRLSPAPGECYFGQWVASAGDSDGDGYVDLAVTTGSGGTCSDSTSTNHVQIFRGSQTGVTSIVSSDIDMGSTSMGYFGEAQQIAAMDINGDGVGDLAIGQWGGGAAGFAGSVNILLGRTGTGFPATFSQFLSGSSEANFGQLGTGDVDGDGYGDLIVGAFGTDSVFVYRGGAGSAGVSTVPWATLTGSGGFGYYVALRPNSTPTANDPWRRRRAVRTSHAGDEVGSQLACPPVPLEIIRVTRHG